MRIVFAGTPVFASIVLQSLLASDHETVAVYSQPDRPAGRGRSPRLSAVTALAVERSVPVLQPASLREPDAARILAQWRPDVVAVAAYGLIVPPAMLAVPVHGCINVHASLLPRWRGAAPIQRAILAGDRETGISIMRMDEGLDTGPVYATRALRIEGRDTAGTLHDRLAQLGARMLLETLSSIAAAGAKARAQHASGSSYAARVEKSEAYIDWSASAGEIDRLVRAFNPAPVAYTTLPDRARLRIWSARAIDHSSRSPAGSIVARTNARLRVATGSGILDLLEVQPEAGRRMPVADYLNARAPTEGAVLGA